jgi:CDP-glycerol glycerophosphotransferase (TagB/SpsB family)
MSERRYLLFVTKPYSFAVLEPIQQAIEASQRGRVVWFTAGRARGIKPPGEQLQTTKAVKAYAPHAVLVPGNVVPPDWPGIKVQIFHGLGEEKRGHYRITGFFDLYCTPGPEITEKFEALAERHGHFLVRETGWPKLDRLDLSADRRGKKQALGLDPERPVLLYAPTFSPRYSSARALLPEIRKLQTDPYQWLVKFHDLMDPRIARDYAALQNDHLRLLDEPNILPAMEAADVLITDTSSVAYEFLLLDRPIVTFRATTRLDKGIDFTAPSDLFGALERVLHDPEEMAPNRQFYREQLHPYTDGRSAYRVLDAIEEVLNGEALRRLKPKPRNWLRRWQLRRLVS